MPPVDEKLMKRLDAWSKYAVFALRISERRQSLTSGACVFCGWTRQWPHALWCPRVVAVTARSPLRSFGGEGLEPGRRRDDAGYLPGVAAPTTRPIVGSIEPIGSIFFAIDD